MTDEVTPTPAEAVNKPEETVTPESTEAKAPEQTVEETLAVPEAPKEEKPTVGLDKFLEQKKQNKELKSRLEALEKQIGEGATKREVSKDIRALATEHNVDPEFLESFAEAVRERAEAVVDEKLRPLTEREAAQKREQLFKQHIDATLEEMPEYKDVVNVDILKQLAFNPANAKKTFRQLLEETYGNVVKPRKSIETTTPRGGAQGGALDYEKALHDAAYFKEVMADKELKKQYNEEMFRRS